MEQGDLALHFNALGTVTAFNTVNVKPRVNGELVKVLFQEEQEVKAGDLLAVVDPRTYKAALAQAEGTLMQNQAATEERRDRPAAPTRAMRRGLDRQADSGYPGSGSASCRAAQAQPGPSRRQHQHKPSPRSAHVSRRLGEAPRRVDIGNLVAAAIPRRWW